MCNFWIDKNIGPMPEHVARRHRFRQRDDNWYDILFYGNLHGSRGCTGNIYARGEGVEVETTNAGSHTHSASIKYLDSSVSNHRIARNLDFTIAATHYVFDSRHTVEGKVIIICGRLATAGIGHGKAVLLSEHRHDILQHSGIAIAKKQKVFTRRILLIGNLCYKQLFFGYIAFTGKGTLNL